MARAEMTPAGANMKNTLLWTLGAVLVLIAGLEAHHSFSAQYDEKQSVVLTGTVTRLRMAMPHAFVYMDVPDEGGKTASWAVEFGNPNQLYRSGWTKDTMKPGMQVTIRGSRARDGSNSAHGSYVQLADGTVLMNQGRATELAPKQE
jgi:hypothetical protein